MILNVKAVWCSYFFFKSLVLIERTFPWGRVVSAYPEVGWLPGPRASDGAYCP